MALVATMLSLGGFSQSSESTTAVNAESIVEASASSTDSALATRDAASASTAAVGAAAGASISHAKKNQSGVHAKYSNYMNGPAFKESSGTSINHIATVKYDFENKYALSANLRFDSTFGEETDLVSLSDPYMVLVTPAVKLSSVNAKGQLWYTFGISDAAKAADIVGVIQPRISFSASIKKLSVSNDLISKFYVHGARQVGQKFAALGSYLNLSYELAKSWTMDLGLYPEFSFLRGKSTTFNNLAAYPGFTVSLGKHVSLSPYVELFAMKPQSETTSVGAFLSASIF